jgi:trimeric autotransporter adhesin
MEGVIFNMANKRVFKLATASAVAASALVAAVPASAASVTYEQAEKQVNKAREAANGLHAEYTRNADYVTQVDSKEARDELARAKAKIAALSSAKEKAYLSSRIQGTIDTVARANAYNNAVRAGGFLGDAAEEVNAALANGVEDLAAAQTAQEKLNLYYKVSQENFGKVYGKEIQANFKKEYITEDLVAFKANAYYGIATRSHLVEADKAIKANDVATAEKYLGYAQASVAKVTVDGLKTALTSSWTKLSADLEAIKVPKVESVSAINLKEVVVTFNQDIDASNAGTYTFPAGSGLTASVQSVDGKTVVLSVTGVSAQQQTADLTIDAVKTKEGKSVAKTTSAVKFVDVFAPTVSGVSVSGPSKVTVSFSEPLQTKPTFSVDNGLLAIAGDNWVAGTKEVELTLGATPSEGLHTVTVENGTDYAGFKVEKVSKEFTYSKDVTAPTFTVKSASETQVVLAFNEVVSNVADANVTFYHTNIGTSAYAATKSVNGKEVTLTFANPLPTGNVNLFLEYTNDNGTKLQDAWGNKVAETSFTANVVSDVTAPTITKVEPKSNTAIEVTYSEAVTGATNSANYSVKDAEGNVVPFTNVTPVSGNTYSVNLASPLNGGSYSLTVKNVTDSSFKLNKIADFTTSVVVADKVAPTIGSTPALLLSNTKVKINFSEAMDAATITNKNNYLFGSAALDSAVKLTAVDNNKAVILDFSDVASGAQMAPASATINVGRVADANGNLIAAFQTAVTVPGTVSNALFEKAEVVGQNTVKFYFDEVISSLVATDFAVSIDNGTTFANTTAITNISIVDGKTVVTATTANNLPSNATNVKVKTNATPSGKNSYGAPIAIADTTTAADKYAPVFSTAQALDADTDSKVDGFTLTFSENLYVASVQETDFSVEGYEITGVSTSGATVTLTVKEKTTADTTATPKVTLVGSVEDSARNVRNTQEAVTASSVASSQAAADAAAVATAKANLALSVTNDTQDPSTISLAGTQDGASVTWAVSGTGGTIAGSTFTTAARTTSTQTATLTATITKGASTDTVTFTVTVADDTDTVTAGDGTFDNASTVVKN